MDRAASIALDKIIQEYDPLYRKMEKNLNPRRMEHVLGCAREAGDLADCYGQSVEKAVLAGLFHDFFRELSGDEILSLAKNLKVKVGKFGKRFPKVLHGPVAAAYLRKEGLIRDPEILEGIACHTLGEKDMGPVAKIVFMADALEPGRSYPGVEELRQKVRKMELDRAFALVLKQQILDMVGKGKALSKATVRAYNQLEGQE